MSIRNIFIRLIANVIYFLRKQTLLIGHARFVVFTGTSGKTLARSSTAYALRKTGHTVISPPYGYTNELGIVLAALGVESTKLFSLSGLRSVFFGKLHHETYVCVELGADWYPDTNWFLKRFKPFGICLTNTTKDEWVRPLSVIWEEKKHLVENISSYGFVCFSSHNESSKKIRELLLSSSVPVGEFTVTEKDATTCKYSVNNNNTQFNSSYTALFPYREAFGTALSCLYALGIKITSEGFFSEYIPVKDRLLITRLASGATLMADTYKAIPQCAEYVLQLARSRSEENKIVVFSEMRPVWKNKEKHYNHVASLLKDFSQVYFIGPTDIAELLSKQLPNLFIIKNSQEYTDLAKKITSNTGPETLYVVKGSAHYQLSELVTLLLVQ